MNGKIIINKNMLVAIVIAALMLIAIVAYFVYKNISIDGSTPPKAETEVSLNGIDAGSDWNTLQKNLGQPTNPIENRGAHEIYSYDNLKVEVYNNKVYALMTDSPGVKTSHDVQVGSSASEIISGHGSDFEKKNDAQLRIYEYSKSALNNQKGVLKFSVDANERVVSIIASLKEDDNIAAEEAKIALHKFLNTIARSESEIRRAYKNMLTNYYQAMVTEDVFVKMCEQFSSLNFTKEFQVQKASSNSVILKFEAESRTKVPDGILYKHWIGEIKMANEVNSWKIDSVKAENDLTVLEAPKE